MITRIGSSNPVHCTSVGKAILAFLPEERDQRHSAPHEVRALYASHHRHGRSAADGDREDAPPRIRRGRRGIGRRAALHRRAVARCAALPVAAVSVSGPSFRVTAQKLPSIANHLLQCVRGISADMGFTSAGRSNRVGVACIEAGASCGQARSGLIR